MKKIVILMLMMLVLLGGCSGSESAEPTMTPTPTVTPIPTPDPFDVVDAVTAQEYVNQMGFGWNLGNTLDPANCTWVSNHMDYETAWGNPKVVKKLITYIKSEGFDTIRVPVSWKDHVEADGTIKADWMARVQEVVDWCVEEDLFIILNIHHEGDWLLNASKDYDGTMELYKTIWTQIAEQFGDYNEKLIFESMNEIGFDDLGTKKGCELISKINAEFVELVRNSGKKNGERYLLLAGYWTDIERTCTAEYTVPEDDRIMVSVHYYTPSTFAIADKTSTWGYRETWGTESDFKELEKMFELLKKNFIDNGIPVIVGEYGAAVKDKDEGSRILWFESVAKTCIEYGCCPVMWDNGEVINRYAYEWKTEGLGEAMRALMKE